MIIMIYIRVSQMCAWHVQVVPNLGGRAAFLCGPTEMMAAMASALNSLDFPLLQLHQESFSF